MKHILNLIRNSAIYIAITNLLELYHIIKHKHDWVYSRKEEEIKFGNQMIPIKLNFKTRYCTKCGAKEIMNPLGRWNPATLTKEEERDKKLRDLGI